MLDAASRPGRETGARIETLPPPPPARRVRVAPVARPGRGLKPVNGFHACTAFRRPGRETGARIETDRKRVEPQEFEGRPGRETGARIETWSGFRRI